MGGLPDRTYPIATPSIFRVVLLNSSCNWGAADGLKHGFVIFVDEYDDAFAGFVVGGSDYIAEAEAEVLTSIGNDAILGFF